MATKTIKTAITLVERIPDAGGKDKSNNVNRPPGTPVTLPADEADRILGHKEWGAEEVKVEKAEAAGDEIDTRKRR